MSRRPVNFLRPRQAPLAGWILLAIGLSCLAAALSLEQHWASERIAAERAAQQDLAADRAKQSPPSPAEPKLAERRRQQARLELQRPWLFALRSIESATVNPVFLLSMTIEPSNGLIKLVAEAPSFDHALAYVQMLDEGGVLQPATMASHEQAAETGTEGSGVRFSAVTHWSSSRVEQ